MYGNGKPTSNAITVNSNVVANIILKNVNIDVSSIENGCAFNMTDANVTLVLLGTNRLKSGGNSAGLQAPEGATLIISNRSTGTLNVTGGTINVIGYEGSGGSITISGGTITATGGVVVTSGGFYYGTDIGSGSAALSLLTAER